MSKIIIKNTEAALYYIGSTFEDYRTRYGADAQLIDFRITTWVSPNILHDVVTSLLLDDFVVKLQKDPEGIRLTAIYSKEKNDE